MTLLRQTLLGSTCLRSLTIVDLPSHKTPNHKDTRTLIFQLPDELLVPIFEFVASQPDVWRYETNQKNEMLLVLSRVCRRMRRVAQQLLYQDICVKRKMTLDAPMVPPSIQVIRLHRTLRGRDDLRKHCRSLHMHIPDVGSPPKDASAYSIAEDLADWLTNTRKLTIHGGFEDGRRRGDKLDGDIPLGNERTWSLIRRISANFENLEHLEISRESWGLYLPDIFRWVEFPRLKTLRLHGISEAKHELVTLAPETLHTASFTSLSISDWEESPSATHLLLKWPKSLTSFTFGSFYSSPHIMNYPLFENWLLVHSTTLTHIDIGYLYGTSRLLNATLFPALAFLRLSRWQMNSPIKFTPEDANVLGPAMKTFAWNFNIYDQHSEGWRSFGEDEEIWVRRLGECAVERGAVLEKIEIEFRPDECWSTKEEMGYPWDRMARVRDETLRPNGVELVHTEPLITREAWLEFVRRREVEDGGDGLEVDHRTEDQQSDGADEERDAEMPKTEPVSTYQGEDIREYFVSVPKDS